MSSPSVLTLNPNNYTPVMQQYLQARQSLGAGTVLFFRMGDFYEAFFEDAEVMARDLEITLTSRPDQTHPGGRIPMAGVPAKAVAGYVAKLLASGHKVAIAEQMADPKTCKGLVPREVTKIYTPGTIDELDLLNSYQNNFMLAVYPEGDRAGVAYTDISTGEFYITELALADLETEMARISPSEVLVPSQRKKQSVTDYEASDVAVLTLPGNYYKSNFDQRNFDLASARANISRVFGVTSLTAFSASEHELGIRAAGAIINYLTETQSTASESAQNPFRNFDVIRSYQLGEYMLLDASARRNLELTRTLNGVYAGSLMSAIDRTSSNLGKRRLKAWLEQPLMSVPEITERANAVSVLCAAAYSQRQALSELIGRIYDLERLSSRLARESMNGREMVALKSSLEKVPEISLLLRGFATENNYLSPLLDVPDFVFSAITEIDTAIVDEAPILITEGGLIKHGYNQELDEYIDLVRDSETWLSNFEIAERERSRIKNLKVSYNKIHGYFIEISKGNLGLVPDDYIAKQTMVNGSRFITPELKDFEDKITNAETRRNALEHGLFVSLRSRLSAHALELKELAQRIAALDVLLSFAQLALERAYVRPVVTSSTVLNVEAGRHPVVEQKLVQGKFVANDIFLVGTSKIGLDQGIRERGSGADSSVSEHVERANNADISQYRLSQESIMLLTGPNMAGKSTYMRQAALIIILAQIGSYVPATVAEIGVVDRVFTRIGASDDLGSGQSTFMVEMSETAQILNGMSERSFIILDEIGRGTSTYDGVAIASAVLEYIATTTNARTVFATHYHELSELAHSYPNIGNHQMLVTESKGEIEFLHQVATGSAERSYGIEVARLAGLPSFVLNRARSVHQQLQGSRPKKINAAKKPEAEQDISKLPLFQ